MFKTCKQLKSAASIYWGGTYKEPCSDAYGQRSKDRPPTRSGFGVQGIALYGGYIGMMENKMETSIQGVGFESSKGL